MKHLLIVIIVLVSCFQVRAQVSISEKLESAWTTFTQDPQLKHGLSGMCVMDAATGNVLFEKNSDIGMAPASTQKVVISIAAFEAFGPAFQFQTNIGYTGEIKGHVLNGDLVITGSGDPTLASSRFTLTKEEIVLKNILNAIKQAGIDSITGNIIGTDAGFDLNPTPEGWIWGDIGNYYGAGHWAINWNENGYDLFSKTGSKQNEPVELVNTKPAPPFANVINDVKTGKPGTGDASIIFADPFSTTAIFQGKLEPSRPKFAVSGAMPNADLFALNRIKTYLQDNSVYIGGRAKNSLSLFVNKEAKPKNLTGIYNLQSPKLDSIVYWFMTKSINLYGEALLRRIGLDKKGFGSVKNGLEWIDSLLAANKFDMEALHLSDGSGLSPANRVTPGVMTQLLFYAKSRNWFSYFYDAIPLYNGMKLKSGTIGRVKCFAGYHTAKSGEQYIVTFMVNNYNSSPSALVNKMYTVLNVLK
jgi:D-alanyl-D-alanine carboxypeptidase/D-alanyl-D-alanine-endopeptidase (penicillin-binding protein 4)